MPTFIRLHQHLLKLLCLLTCVFYAQFSTADNDPRAVVESAAKAMTSRLISDKDKIANQEYYLENLVDELLLPAVDHELMAKKVLAKH